MILKITSKRRVTFPAKVLAALGLGPGDRIRLEKGPDGYILRSGRIDHSLVGTLRDKLAPGRGPFDLQKFREQPRDPALRN